MHAVGTMNCMRIHGRFAILAPEDDRRVLIHTDRAAVRDLEVIASRAFLELGYALVGCILRQEVHGQPMHAHLADHVHLFIGDVASDGHFDLHHLLHPPFSL